MVNIVKRMRVLRELLWIRTGPGALLLPNDVTKIGMEFSARIEGGHRGARKFWREMLPKIKYRNPTIPIEISRHKEPDGPSLLHIFTSTVPSTKPPTHLPTLTPSGPPTHSIDVKSLSESAILEKLIEATGAKAIETTPEQQQQMEEIKEFKERSEKDREMVREKLMKERREQALLKMARGDAAASS
ncbi:hypothetical protein P280DRAFT_491070 [Massarina eburnea CBS 473.64]|uniref:Ribosomal protein/NADH dehydrogenase domain-containing protein n=1 Tax=Massarina eburnea CBS 473.64 TaxID=1395130 RepID=A0A6A6RV23_9PLEO|nr:hypothetical protein P280DRAFT_491070 [Massarina eburnea CBS 473.64]